MEGRIDISLFAYDSNRCISYGYIGNLCVWSEEKKAPIYPGGCRVFSDVQLFLHGWDNQRFDPTQDIA